METVAWIATTGPPGSGKTMLRQSLALKLDASPLDVVDCYPLDSSFTPIEATQAFRRLMSALSGVDQHRPAVIEAMFYQAERGRELVELAKESNAQVTFVVLDASLECLVERVEARPTVFQKPITAERIAELKAKFLDYDGDLRFRTDELSLDDISRAVVAHVRLRGSDHNKNISISSV
jgi:predicted kinase